MSNFIKLVNWIYIQAKLITNYLTNNYFTTESIKQLRQSLSRCTAGECDKTHLTEIWYFLCSLSMFWGLEFPLFPLSSGTDLARSPCSWITVHTKSSWVTVLTISERNDARLLERFQASSPFVMIIISKLRDSRWW